MLISDLCDFEIVQVPVGKYLQPQRHITYPCFSLHLDAFFEIAACRQLTCTMTEWETFAGETIRQREGILRRQTRANAGPVQRSASVLGEKGDITNAHNKVSIPRS
jgi:hypothetical protein